MRRATSTSLSIVVILLSAGCGHNTTAGSQDGAYRTITVDPGRDTEAARRLNEKGLKQLAEGDLDASEATFKKALEADVRFGPAHNNLGRVYYAKRQWHDAAWEFEYARKLMPQHAGPPNNLGLIYLHASPPARDVDKAIDYFREALSLEPSNMSYAGNLASALVDRGDRSQELGDLLRKIVENDTRLEWVEWARMQLLRLGS